MIKINLITKHEQAQLDKLREAHRFYLDNGGREIRQRKIQRAFQICREALDLAEAISKAFSGTTAKTTKAFQQLNQSYEKTA